MNRTLRAGVAALAFAGLVAQPMVANAGIYPPCIRIVPVTPSDPGGPIPMLLVTGFFICAGLAIGRQDVQAHGQPVSGKARLGVLIGCLLPFHFHKQNVVSAKD